MLDTMHNFPEFKHPLPEHYRYQTPKGNAKKANLQFVGGGFSALGNPASFHNPWVRKIREWCMATMVPFFGDLLNLTESKGYHLEQIIDRMMYRPIGQKPSKEAWHRDETPNALSEDMMFGGWINLDSHPQYFSCVPGTHHILAGDHKTLKKGFYTIGKREHERLNRKKFKVTIPPGHIMVFFENTIHEVLPSANKQREMYRVFLGWRLTQSTEALHLNNNLHVRLTNQAVMPLKSNQTPPMWPKLWNVNSHRRLIAWSHAVINPTLLITRRRKDQMIQSCPQTFQSLAEHNLPMYPEYTEREMQIYAPGNSWQLKVPGRENLYKTYYLSDDE